MSSRDRTGQTRGTVPFLLGVLVGAVSGAVAGWAVSGHLAPVVAGVLHVIGRDADDRQVHFEAMQQ